MGFWIDFAIKLTPDEVAVSEYRSIPLDTHPIPDFRRYIRRYIFDTEYR